MNVKLKNILINTIRIFILFSILFLFNSNVFSQRQPILLKYADSLVGRRGTQNIDEFIGRVSLQQGDVFVTCNRAVQYHDENRVEVQGNVIIRQNDMNLYAPKAEYNGNTKIATGFQGVKIIDKNSTLTADNGIYSTQTNIADFYGNVRIEDDSTLIFSDRIIYHQNKRNSFAYGSVLIKSKNSNSILFGDTIEHYPSDNITLVYGKPVLTQIDTVKSVNKSDSLTLTPRDSITYRFDTLSISCKKIESYRSAEKEVYYFRDSVEIYKGKILSKADTAIYDKLAETFKLRGKPIVWYDSTQLYADSINIKAENRKLSEIIAFNNALTASRSDTNNIEKINQVIGNKIIISFEQDSIKAVYSYGSSKSLYFMGEEKNDDGAARNSADSIVVKFSKGEPEKILWLGGIQGEMFPGNLLENPRQYYLPNFRWTEIKPIKKIILNKFVNLIK